MLFVMSGSVCGSRRVLAYNEGELLLLLTINAIVLSITEPQNVTVQNVTAIGMGTNSIQVTWEAVPLIQARRFFNYTATLTVSSSKREAPNRKVVSCTAACSVNFMVEPGRSYIVQVGITGFQSTFSSSGKTKCI